MARSKDYNKRHSANLDRYAGQIGALFDLLASEATRIGAGTGLEDGSAGFSFDRFPLAKKKARALLAKIRKEMLETIESGIRKEWDLSEAKNAALVERLLAGSGLEEDVVRSLQPRNADALEAFVGRKERGLVLSDRVWNITSQAMAEAEAALGLAIGTGKDAQALSRDVRHLLKRPDEMWRRYYVTRTRADGSKVKEAEWRHKVVGQDGKVHFVSEPLSHPGRGVYRSSYRNALRLAVTETNMAYHKADALAWQQSPACIGIEVVLSNNHTSRGVKGLFFDICDELAGRYPKDFTFTGWHPFCRCVAVPLTASREDFVRYLKDKMAGKDVSRVEFPGTIKHMPDNFTKWKEDNHGRIEAMKRKGTLPEFLKEDDAPRHKEIAKAQKELVNWYKENLPMVNVGKFSAKRFETKATDGTSITVNRTFYNETINKHQDEPTYLYKLEYARKAHELIKNAKLINAYEKSIDHPDAHFRVYEVVDEKYRVEMKVKCNNDGNFLYILRLYKR